MARLTGGANYDAAKRLRILHLRIEEKLTIQAGRNGGLELMELIGILQVKASTPQAAGTRIKVDATRALTGSERRPPAVLQTHPNIDKKIFQVSENSGLSHRLLKLILRLGAMIHLISLF
ncbi:unnamed protein product [Protopolystoma xenopodis]|uniref:Uncharacterized protein n=1 Tax=Protopolystoma xenopodis TaxID=117903 RepID=A0A448WTJ9_9PLAT|nr:unnamed protein product [Protopolystoma xenopodis]